jgi:FecR protein
MTAKLSLLMAAALGLSSVCSAQSLGSDSTKSAAKVITLTGRVSVIRDSNPEQWALQVGDQIQAKQLIITGPDGQATFEVADGSTFVVYPNSRVVFRKNEPNWSDLLDVLVGRIKIHIEHLYGPNPNRVLTPTAVISVRGTTFDVEVDGDNEATMVEVEEGVVDVRHAMLGGNTKTLNTGESIRVYRDVPIAQGRINKGDLAQRVLRAMVDAVSTWESKIPRGSAGGGGGGSESVPGSPDTGKGAPPPPPPPPPSNAPSPAPGFIESGGHIMILTRDEPEHEGKWHKTGRVILRTVRAFLLGPPPGQDVIIHLRSMR